MLKSINCTQFKFISQKNWMVRYRKKIIKRTNRFVSARRSFLSSRTWRFSASSSCQSPFRT